MRKMLLVLVVLLATGCGQSWHEYRSNKGGYSVEVPGTVKEDTSSVTTPIGAIAFHTAVSEGSDYGYATAYADFPDFVVKQDHKDLLTGARDGALRNIDGKLDKQTWIEIDGHQGLEMTFTSSSKKMKAKARIILVKNRLYQAIAAQTEDSYDEQEVDRYLKSFRLRPVL